MGLMLVDLYPPKLYSKVYLGTTSTQNVTLFGNELISDIISKVKMTEVGCPNPV